MGVVGYFELDGIKYGIGTIVEIPLSLGSRVRTYDNATYRAKFVGGGQFVFIGFPGSASCYDFNGEDGRRITIIEPVYYQEPEPPKSTNIFLRTKSGSWDAHNDVCLGLVWYIAVMLLASIFNARAALWTLATIVYFSWKSKK